MARNSAGGDNSRSPKSDELLWLETYFIVFPCDQRPTLAQVEHALAEADPHLQLENLAADDDGRFASLLVQSPEDHAAVEVSFETGDAVVEQNLQWAKQLQKQLTSKHLQQFMTADARLDVAHFERVQGGASVGSRDEYNADEFDSEYGDDDLDAEAELEIFDPTCLLTVVETLSKLTRGLAFDPAAGEVV